jgi:FtsP/CotA-like multicopper oxidase with cupredoxin domain
MKTIKQSFSGSLASALVLALLVTSIPSQAYAEEVYLEARQFIKNIRDGSDPNGNGRARVRMWGYRQCVPDFTGCAGQPVQSPGPVIRVPAGDTSLTIRVRNRLPTSLQNITNETSVYVPGLPKALAVERWSGTGDAQKDGRIYSFDTPTPRTPNNQSIGVYTWDNLTPGTYLYHSGTHPQVQVQMGLYGAIVVEAGTDEAYPGVTYDQDPVLLFSEVDPAIHDAVDNDTYGTAAGPTSTQLYQPRFFLINGEPFFNSPPLVTAEANDDILLRLVNAGIESHSPQILGGYFDVIAEDGHVAPTQRERHSILLPAGKTQDVLFTPPATATHVLFDRSLRTVNDTGHAGGMFGRIRVGLENSGGTGNGKPGIGNAPIANNDTFFITSFNGAINTGAPGVLGNDADPNSDPIRVTPPLGAIRATLANAPATATLSVVTGTNPATAGRVSFNPRDPAWVGVATFEYTVTENYPGIPIADQLVSGTATASLVRDQAITTRVFHNPPGTASDAWELAGNTRGASSVSISIVPNANNANCNFVGPVATVTPATDGSWTYSGTQANPGGCNRISVAAEIPAADGIDAHTATLETNFQRQNP